MNSRNSHISEGFLKIFFIVEYLRCNGFGVAIGDNWNRLILKFRRNFKCYFFVLKNVAEAASIYSFI